VGLRLLAGREMSTARVRARLAARGFPGEVIDDTVSRLVRAGALDDRRAAHSAARTLVAVRLRGRHRVGRELEQLGFGRADAADALRAVLSDIDEAAVLARVVRTKLRGRRAIPDAAEYRRVFAALLRRGFPGDRIRAALQPYWRSRGGEPDD
jgi:SOS response regulatory protein OraA/RecX